MTYKAHVVAPVLAEQQGWRCPLCGDPLTLDDLTIDHIRSRAAGGRDSYRNWQVAHRACNQLKGKASTYIGNCWQCRRAVDSEEEAANHYAVTHPRDRRRPNRPNGKRRKH